MHTKNGVTGSGTITVMESAREVRRFLEDVRRAADSDKDALGFFPSGVYEEFARKGQLYVASIQDGDEFRYAGHLLFDCRCPRSTVLQMFVAGECRGRGVAKLLLRHLVDSLTAHGFISIYARVAEDLLSANRFWEQNSFYVQRVERGGNSRKRTILVRVRELESAQLFSSSGLTPANPLGLSGERSAELPIFLLDLNVLFDVGPRRPKHQAVESLYHAERMNYCRLAISSEVRDELKRTATTGRTDPMEAFISLFPTFPLAKEEQDDACMDELRRMIFAGKDVADLTDNDRSDLVHVATVIQHKLSGLVTNDDAILNAAPELERRFGIRVISSAAFLPEPDVMDGQGAVQTLSNTTLESREVGEVDAAAIHHLLGKLGLSGSAIATTWLRLDAVGRLAHQIGVWRDGVVSGYLTWPARTPDGTVIARIAIDETGDDAPNVTRALLMYLLAQVRERGPRRIDLEFPSNQSVVREIAFGLGFSGTASSHSMMKLADGRVWTPQQWGTYQAELSRSAALRLPEVPPLYRSAEQQIPVFTPDGNRVHVTLSLLETLLAPVIFCLKGRPAVITPIQRSYAEPLLGHSPQGSLLPDLSASLFADKHFVCTSRALKHFKQGTIILFYESSKRNGRSALVAMARVRSAHLREMEMLSSDDLERSVLTQKNVSDIGVDALKTIVVFDSVLALKQQIPLKVLEQLGCGRPTDLLTTRPISDDQLQEILIRAFPSE